MFSAPDFIGKTPVEISVAACEMLHTEKTSIAEA